MSLPSTVTPPVRLTPDEAAAAVREIERRRTETARWLRQGATSYLATVERRDFEDRTTLVVGSGPQSDVRIDDPSVAGRHVAVEVVGDVFRVTALGEDVSFRVGGDDVREATLGPGYVELGRFRLRLSHQGYPAVVVLDRHRLGDAPPIAPRWFPVDLAYRFVAPLARAARPETVEILSTRGHRRRAERVGWFDLALPDGPVRLAAMRLLEPGVGESAHSVFFRDATTGRETYPVGRYLDPEPLGDGRFLVDLNAAYNPACAFSPHYNCPIPPDENVLAVAVRAGEMTPEGAH